MAHIFRVDWIDDTDAWGNKFGDGTATAREIFASVEPDADKPGRVLLTIGGRSYSIRREDIDRLTLATALAEAAAPFARCDGPVDCDEPIYGPTMDQPRPANIARCLGCELREALAAWKEGR